MKFFPYDIMTYEDIRDNYVTITTSEIDTLSLYYLDFKYDINVTNIYSIRCISMMYRSSNYELDICIYVDDDNIYRIPSYKEKIYKFIFDLIRNDNRYKDIRKTKVITTRAITNLSKVII